MTLADMSPLANHLWQSTFFAAVAWLLTLALRKNRAAVRYCLWMAASVKFLIPFAWMARLGAMFVWRVAPVAGMARIPVLVEQIGQPFQAIEPASAVAGVPATQSFLWPAVLLGVWLCGVAVGVVFWIRSARRIGGVVRGARAFDLNLPIPVMAAPERMEPGVFGIWKPVLLLPEGIIEHLTPRQLEAILAHELRHVHRRDNLTSAIHMLVETVFWFHPAVWWIRARLVEEREWACDEGVLLLGSEPRVYAESILKVCEFYLSTPLACVSGVTGADLKKRIEAIMSNRSVLRLNFARKAMLAAAALTALAAPVVVGILNAPAIRAQSPQAAPSMAKAPVFEVASVKLNPDCNVGSGRPAQSPVSFNLPCLPLRGLIRMAYSAQAGAVFPSHVLEALGGPGWLDTDRYDIFAKAAGNASSSEMMGPMLRTLLEDRFKVKVHKESRDAPVYELTVANNNPKLQPSKDGSCVPMDLNSLPQNIKPGDSMPKFCGAGGGTFRDGRLVQDWYGVSMAELAGRMFASHVDRPVIDKTGLTGRFDVHLEFAPDDAMSGPGPVLLNGVDRPGAPSTDPTGPSIFTALQEQLGLKLSPAKGPVEVIVIDRAEKPSAN
jgi:uncharacterized protein (TIGR03435 family)